MGKKNQARIHNSCSHKSKLSNNKKQKKAFYRLGELIKGGLIVIISVLMIYGIVQAGSLAPLANPIATSYTLADIYTRLTTNATAIEGNHLFAPGGAPASTPYTLTEIYNAIPTIDTTQILTGNTYLGIAGTYDASSLSEGTVKKGTLFGVSLTGDYPSATYNLPGDTGATDAVAGDICASLESWTKEGDLITGSLTPVAGTILNGTTICGVPGTVVPSPTFGDNDSAQVLTTAANPGTYDATNLTPANVRNTIAFGAGQTGTFTGALAYGDNNAANVLTTAATPGTYNVSNLLDSVIKQGTTWGVSLGSTGTLVPSGGNATTGNVLSGQTFFGDSQADWVLQTGTMANNGAFSLTAGAVDQLVTAGYYSGGTLSGDADLITTNIRSGVNIFGVVGDSNVVNTSTGDAAVGDIVFGKKAWIDGLELTGTMANNGAFSLTASASDQPVTAGYYSGGTLAGDADLVVGKIKSGVDIFGVTGDYPSTTYTLPSADGTTDLASGGGNISSANGAVEWWQSDGTRQTATLDFPTISNVCSTDTSNNSTGTLSINANYVSVGNTYCSTAGTLLANQFNGTGQGVTGGSQANGGVDDWNAGGVIPIDRYLKGWTLCTLGNSYCGTNNAGADAKDDSTGLIWSYPCNGIGCTSFSDAAVLNYTWDNSGGNNNSRTASQLCSDQAGWSLPHQKQLMQAQIDGSWGNLEEVHRATWSATTRSNGTGNAWYTYLSHGYTFNQAKTLNVVVRCIR